MMQTEFFLAACGFCICAGFVIGLAIAFLWSHREVADQIDLAARADYEAGMLIKQNAELKERLADAEYYAIELIERNAAANAKAKAA